MASQDILAEDATPAETLRRASLKERDGRAAGFAALVCVAGGLAFLIGQLGWWTLLIGPAYLAGTGFAAMLAQGRTNALLAVALATASTALAVGLMKLSGLA